MEKYSIKKIYFSLLFLLFFLSACTETIVIEQADFFSENYDGCLIWMISGQHTQSETITKEDALKLLRGRNKGGQKCFIVCREDGKEEVWPVVCGVV
jgi:hypothetical protein